MSPAEIIPLKRRKSQRDKENAEILAAYDRMSPRQRELLMVIMRALRRDLPDAVRVGPDADLIRKCRRLLILEEGTKAVFQAVPNDERARQPVIDLINVEWFALMDQLFKLEPPRTSEGAQVAAKALLALSPDGLPGAVQDADPLRWLALGLAGYLTREA